MSFLSKLFRGGAQAPDVEPSEVEQPAQGAADEQPAAAVGAEQNELVKELAEAPSPAAPHAETEAEDTEPTEETPWWAEDVAEIAASPDATVASDTSTAEQDLTPQPEDATAVFSPLESPETPSSDEIDTGTNPLNESDVPMLMALRSPRGLAAAAQRDIGRVRSINQDSIFAMLTTLPREGSDVTVGLFVVADGMGGHDGGEVASRIAVTTVARAILSELVLPALADNVTEALQPLIITAVQDANRAIWEHAQAVGSDMGTTCTVALLLGHALYIGHVGDSRAYLMSPTTARVLTSDHSAVGRLIDVGQLDPSEARDHPMRSQLYRTVGQHPEVVVDFIYQPIGDATHLLLCSDGLWGLLDDELLLDVLNHSVWPQDACRELIARANLAGGDDNISAVVVTLPAQH